MLNLSLNQASRRLSVAKGPARALNSASTTCCSVRAVGGLPSSRRSLRERSATRPTLPCTKRNKQQQQEEERSHLLLCRATPEQDTEAPEQESPSESRKLLKNVFYVASAIALPIVAWSEVVTITTGEGLQGLVLGGLEGVSYLVLLGLVGKSIALKVRTGTGLPAGPYGLIGAMEGIAYLEVVGFIASQVFHK